MWEETWGSGAPTHLITSCEPTAPPPLKEQYTKTMFSHLVSVLCLLEHDEEYVFTLPCAYARSILTVPWVELGGKVSINCAKSGYSATVTFHTKPFYGGKVHR
uniref:Uncharacterized protein n=1 Tax=Myripristis murdjan TaxID=586833 RepID=A0A667XN47_9TELE